MTPAFRVVADGADITALINDRLLQPKTTDKPGMESDEFELRIDDRDSAVVLPARGANIEIFLGYAATSLTRIGRYVVDEIELSGPPDTLVITGKASDMRGSGKTTRGGSWENVPLSRIVADVSARNDWQPVCPVQIKVPRADQLNESDFNFITRLAKQYGRPPHSARMLCQSLCQRCRVVLHATPAIARRSPQRHQRRPSHAVPHRAEPPRSVRVAEDDPTRNPHRHPACRPFLLPAALCLLR